MATGACVFEMNSPQPGFTLPFAETVNGQAPTSVELEAAVDAGLLTLVDTGAVLVFATPAFCQTAVCGPTLEAVKSVAADYPTVTFINVEPYKMVFTDGRLQPELSADGQLQPAAWTEAFGLPSEPWVFVVDRDGKVTAKFETILAADEMKAAIDPIVPTAATGVVTAVDQPSLTDVRGFTLRTANGTELVFSIRDLELTDGAFPANHLREHMAKASPVKVDFATNGDDRIATRLTDAE